MKIKTKRKICVVTGTRAEYGILKPIIEEIKWSKKLDLQIIATAMHLWPTFGLTYKEIEKDDLKINAKVKMDLSKDSKGAMAKSIGKCIVGMVEVLEKLKPDIVVVNGDRAEALATVIAAVYMNIVVAHVHGGDSSRAGLDEYARHAITKLSHLHFPATKKSAQRIIKMGENPEFVYNVGAPCLDTILHGKLIKPKAIVLKYNLNFKKPIILLVQHPVTTEVEQAKNQIIQTLEAIKELEFQTILIYPNADAGGRRIIKIIKKYEKFPFIQTYKSLPHIDYLSLLKVANVMVGNSSSGIIETPSFHLPVVNIGTRQEGRERARNVLDVDHKKNEITKAIKKSIFDRKFLQSVKKCRSPYGKGMAGTKIARILSTVKLDKKLIQKKLTY